MDHIYQHKTFGRSIYDWKNESIGKIAAQEAPK